MGTYTFRTLKERQEVQRLYEEGLTTEQLAAALNTTRASMLRELWRGYQDEVRLPDMRLKYDAELAQLRVQRSLERRGKPRNNKY